MLVVPSLELDQPVEHRHRRRVERRAGGEELRVEALGAAFGAVDEGLGGEGGAGARRAARRRRARRRAGRCGCSWAFRSVEVERAGCEAARRDANDRSAARGRVQRSAAAEPGVAVLHRLGAASPSPAPRRRPRARPAPARAARRAGRPRAARRRAATATPSSAVRGRPRRRAGPSPRSGSTARRSRRTARRGAAAAAARRRDGRARRRRGAGPRSRRWRAAARSSPSCGAGRRGSRRTGRAAAGRRARRTGAPCGRRPSRSGSPPRAESVSPRGVEDRPQDDVGDRPAQALRADHRRPRGRGRSRLSSSLRWKTLVALRTTSAVRTTSLRDPAGDVDRRVALVAQRLHQLRNDVRRARQQAGAQRVRGDHLVEPLEQVAGCTRLAAGRRAAASGDADEPAEEADVALGGGSSTRRRRSTATAARRRRARGVAAAQRPAGAGCSGAAAGSEAAAVGDAAAPPGARAVACARTDSTSGPTTSVPSPSCDRREYRQSRRRHASSLGVERSADRVQHRQPERRA